MGGTALIIGGSGQIGQAVAIRLLADGWRVIAAQQNPQGLPADLVAAGVRPVAMDRNAPGAVAQAVAGGVDALIDTVAFDETHARQLLEIQRGIGALVVISSGSVYCDSQGRTLDEAKPGAVPDFPVPIGEDQPTVAPSDANYSTRKSGLEKLLLDGARTPVTILRPCAIHGPGSRHPREWFFVKRILDGLRRVPLAWNGQSRFHTSATANIAELIAVCLATPATRVLNAADPEALTVSAIAQAIADVYGYELALRPAQTPDRRHDAGARPGLPAGHRLPPSGGRRLQIGRGGGGLRSRLPRLSHRDVRLSGRRRLPRAARGRLKRHSPLAEMIVDALSQGLAQALDLGQVVHRGARDAPRRAEGMQQGALA